MNKLGYCRLSACRKYIWWLHSLYVFVCFETWLGNNFEPVKQHIAIKWTLLYCRIVRCWDSSRFGLVMMVWVLQYSSYWTNCVLTLKSVLAWSCGHAADVSETVLAKMCLPFDRFEGSSDDISRGVASREGLRQPWGILPMSVSRRARTLRQASSPFTGIA